MLRPIAFVITGLFSAGTLFSQNEPQKSPAMGASQPQIAKNPPPLGGAGFAVKWIRAIPARYRRMKSMIISR
jgi:hypothetical protein